MFRYFLRYSAADVTLLGTCLCSCYYRPQMKFAKVVLTGGCLSTGVGGEGSWSLSRGVSPFRGSLSRGSLSGVVSVQGLLCQGGLCPGGLCPWGSLQGSLSRCVCAGKPNMKFNSNIKKCILFEEMIQH